MTRRKRRWRRGKRRRRRSWGQPTTKKKEERRGLFPGGSEARFISLFLPVPPCSSLLSPPSSFYFHEGEEPVCIRGAERKNRKSEGKGIEPRLAGLPLLTGPTRRWRIKRNSKDVGPSNLLASCHDLHRIGMHVHTRTRSRLLEYNTFRDSRSRSCERTLYPAKRGREPRSFSCHLGRSLTGCEVLLFSETFTPRPASSRLLRKGFPDRANSRLQ